MLIPRRPLAVQSRTPSIRGAFERGWRRRSRRDARRCASPGLAEGTSWRRSAFAPGTSCSWPSRTPPCWTTPRGICAATTRSRPPRTRVSGRCFDARARRWRGTPRARRRRPRGARVQGRVRRARGVRAGVPPPTVRLAARVLWRRPARARAPRDGLRTHGVRRKRGVRGGVRQRPRAGAPLGRGRGGGQGEVRARPERRRRSSTLDSRGRATRVRRKADSESGRARDRARGKP